MLSISKTNVCVCVCVYILLRMLLILACVKGVVIWTSGLSLNHGYILIVFLSTDTTLIDA